MPARGEATEELLERAAISFRYATTPTSDAVDSNGTLPGSSFSGHFSLYCYRIVVGQKKKKSRIDYSVLSLLPLPMKK